MFRLATLIACAVICACSTQRPREHVVAAGALGPYSAAVTTDSLVFASGQIGAVRDGTLAEEIEGAIDRVEAVLGDAGVTLADVVSVTVYLTDIADYAEFNAIYRRRMPAPYPARACVAVAALPGGARVEIQATAAR